VRATLQSPAVCLRVYDPEQDKDAARWWVATICGEAECLVNTAPGTVRYVDTGLPTLIATVNAFTRLWLGVGPATGLSFTDDLDGPRDLLVQLDHALRLPDPHPDWDF
jgi:hypothetical protein